MAEARPRPRHDARGAPPAAARRADRLLFAAVILAALDAETEHALFERYAAAARVAGGRVGTRNKRMLVTGERAGL
jgi:hypothetical protein